MGGKSAMKNRRIINFIEFVQMNDKTNTGDAQNRIKANLKTLSKCMAEWVPERHQKQPLQRSIKDKKLWRTITIHLIREERKIYKSIELLQYLTGAA